MRVDIVDKFSPSSSRVCSFVFSTEQSGQYDILYLGMETGKIFFLAIASGQLPHNIRPVDITKEPGTQHNAEVNCLLFSSHKRFTNPQSSGLIFSGSLDRSIKVWSMSVGNQTTHVQTLFGHSSAITKLVDGTDGTILSCSEDGSLRMWSPQRGRNIMLHPFFECTFSMSFGKDVWITCLTVGVLGPWICYAADSNGNIDVLKKGSDDNDVERQVAAFTKQLTRYTRWEKVHGLGITHMELIREENILITLSYDATCKVLDPSTGHVLFHIVNRRRCMYTGATWVKNLTSFYLIDEFGYLDVFNLYHERVIETVELSTLTSKQSSAVLKCHANQAIRDIKKYNQDGYFLTLLASNADPKSLAGSVTGGSTMRLKSVGVIGDVVLWNLSNDVNCMEFVGHEGSVVGISVPSFTSASAARTHTLAPDGSIVSVAHAAAIHPSTTTTTSAAVNTTTKSSILPPIPSSQPGVMRATTLQISSNEKLFFSAGHEDDTLRCWDEYDQMETYQFKSKGISEITVMLAVWHMNRIVTGHENGTVCIWNADTGYRVKSNTLKHTVSSLVEASSAHSKLLIGADYSGGVAIWNLTLHYLNPTQLIAVGNVMEGFHSRDDPGILSLAFHDKTKTIFSGGNDTSVRFWRLHSDVQGGESRTHKESVSLLRCTGSFLLSGDEDGNLNLCRIMVTSVNNSQASASNTKTGSAAAAAMSSFFVTGLTIMCSWNTYPVSMRALGDISELDLTVTSGGTSQFGGGKRILVTHVGPTGTGRTRVWEVWTQKRATIVTQQRTHRAAVGGLEGLRQSAAALLKHELASAAGSVASAGHSVVMQTGEGGGSMLLGEEGSSVAGEPDPESQQDQQQGQGKYRVYDSLHPDLYISVSELYCLNHDKYDISCCTMSTSSSIATPSTATGFSSDKAVVDRAARHGKGNKKEKEKEKDGSSAEEGGGQQGTGSNHNALDAFRQSTLVYMGTSSGMIFRFSFRK